MFHSPRPKQFIPPTKEEQARARKEADAYQAKRKRQNDQERPLRRSLLEAQSLPFRDLEAAIECPCSCHPRVDTSLHDGGLTCTCQKTKRQRKNAMQRFSTFMQSLPPSNFFQDQEHAVEEKAKELGVTAKIAVSGAPFVIVGVVDGRGYYLRERHGEYGVTIASDEDPASNPWSTPPEQLTLGIAEGSDADFMDKNGQFDAGKAVIIAAGTVRRYLRESTCQHPSPSSNYCPNCGKTQIDLTKAVIPPTN